MKFELPDLSYSYDGLEPFIDANTMKIHHQKHHKGYIDKLNKTIEQHEVLNNKSLEELISNLTYISGNIQESIRHNGGGHYNHSFFWNILTSKRGSHPNGDLERAFNEEFGGYEGFKKVFSQKAKRLFGSGWVWAVVNEDRIEIVCLPNQDNPLMDTAEFQGIPFLGLDMWEHAYYLNYQNNKQHYIDNFWNIVDWSVVEMLYAAARADQQLKGKKAESIAVSGIL